MSGRPFNKREDIKAAILGFQVPLDFASSHVDKDFKGSVIHRKGFHNFPKYPITHARLGMRAALLNSRFELDSSFILCFFNLGTLVFGLLFNKLSLNET